MYLIVFPIYFAWATDLMIGNFFMITCPYLFSTGYGGLLRHIAEQSFLQDGRPNSGDHQVLLDVYNTDGSCIFTLEGLEPLFSDDVSSSIGRRDKFIPLTSSLDATRLISYLSNMRLESSKINLITGICSS